MSQSSPKLRVRGGIPWWLWSMIILATFVIVIGAVVTSIPADPEALYEKSLALLQANDRKEFDKVLARLKKVPDYSHHVAFLQGILALKENREPRALEFFETAQNSEKLKGQVLQQKGMALTRLVEFRKAIQAYEQSIQAAPENSDMTRVLIAQLYFAIGAWHHSEGILNKLVEANPDNKAARRLRGLIRKELHRYSEAVEDYAFLLKTPGDKAAADPELINEYVKLIIQLDDRERLKDAELHFAATITDTTTKARLQIGAGKIDEARFNMNELIQSPDRGPPLPKVKAILALKQMKYDDAAVAILDAARYFPRDRETYELATQIFTENGNAEQLAIAQENLRQLKDLEQALFDSIAKIGVDIENAAYRYEVAEGFMRLGQPNDARKWFAMAGNVDPETKARADSAMLDVYQNAITPLVPFTTDSDEPTASDTGTKNPAADTETEKATPTEQSNDANKAPADKNTEPKKTEDEAGPDDDSASSKSGPDSEN